jgi:type II secretory pathway predicted ATPase ExeA
MYLKFFGLQRLPFRLRPDRDFLHLDAAYVATRGSLLRALRGEQSIVVLSGEAGVGKTMLLESAVEELGDSRVPIWISQPQVSPEEMISAIHEQLTATVRVIDDRPGSEVLLAQSKQEELLQAIRALSARRRRPLLIVDQAQLLASESLRMLRLLDFGHSAIDLVLSGRARGAALPAWAGEDVGAFDGESITVLPMTPERVGPYVERRLRVAGAADPQLFSEATYQTLFQYTHGVPRLVNALCDAAMSLACSRAIQRISDTEVLAATREPHWRNLQSQDMQGAGAATAAVVSDAAIVSDAAAVTAPMIALTPGAIVIESAAAERDALAQSGAAPKPEADPAPITLAPPIALAPVALAPITLARSVVAAPDAMVVPALPRTSPPAAEPADAALPAHSALPSPEPMLHRPARRVLPARYRVLVTRDGFRTTELTLQPGQLLIGRTPDNDLVLDDTYVSRSHCALITVTVGAVLRTTLIDLGSRNGVLVNGKPTTRLTLSAGDRIRIGDFVLKYVLSGSPSVG